MKNTLNLTALLALAASLARRQDGTTPPPAAPDTRMTPAEFEAARRAALDKENTGELMNRVIKLEGENYTLRRTQIPEGNALLTAEEKKFWDAYQALGKPDELTASLKTAAEDRQKVERAEKRERLSAVAEAAGWDLDAFSDLDAMAGGLEWTVTEVKGAEGTVKSVTVKDGDKQTDAAEFAESRWKKFLPVLAKSESEEKSPAPSSTPEPIRVPVGGAGGGKGTLYTQADAEAAKAASGQYVM